MWLAIGNPNDPNKPYKFQAWKQDSTITIKIRGQYITVDWYTYESDRINPFIWFFNNTICAFANNKDIAWDKQSQSISTEFTDFFLKEMKKNKFVDDFRGYVMDDPDGKRRFRRIIWKIRPHKNYKISRPNNHEIIIEHDGSRTRCEVLVNVLRDAQEERLTKFFYQMVKKMNIADKVTDLIFDDPTSCEDFFQHTDQYDPDSPKQPFVNGCCYGTREASSKKIIIRGEWRKKSVIVYSPEIFLFEPMKQYLLIVHELVHAKIGYEHSHDSYFWYLFDKYMKPYKCTRFDDWAYRSWEENDDNHKFESRHDEKVEDLIEQDKKLGF